MSPDILFTIAFISQLLLVSVLVPLVVNTSIRRLVASHPEAEFPRLYPQPWAWYATRLQRVNMAHGLALLVGLFFLVVYLTDASKDDYAGIVWLVFMLQSVPYGMLELLLFRQLKLLRAGDDRRVRSASLERRHWRDFVSLPQLAVMAGSYLLFCAFLAWMQQFDLPWFGGWLNAAILGAAYLGMGAGLVLANRKIMRAPYLGEDGRLELARRQVAQFTLVMVALVVYASVTITLRVAEMDGLRQLAMCLYVQALIVGYYLTMLRPSAPDLDGFRQASASA